MDDWQSGDLVICLHTCPRNRRTYGGLERLKAGAVYTVIRVLHHEPEPSLLLEDVRSDSPFGTFHHGRFRKIRPHKADEQDAETIRLLTGKPEQVPA